MINEVEEGADEHDLGDHGRNGAGKNPKEGLPKLWFEPAEKTRSQNDRAEPKQELAKPE